MIQGADSSAAVEIEQIKTWHAWKRDFNHNGYTSDLQNLQKSASDSSRILSKMALKDTNLWCLTAF